MPPDKKKLGAGGHRALAKAVSNCENENACKDTKQFGKIHRVLEALVRRPMTRFEAEREVADHTLNTTVAAIQGRFGIRVDRESVTVAGYRGAPTRCCRYWIAADQRDRALRILRERRQ